MPEKTARSALVLFSGGQDSATCLAWALDRFDHIETVGFDYGQRHRIELGQRGVIREESPAFSPPGRTVSVRITCWMRPSSNPSAKRR